MKFHLKFCFTFLLFLIGVFFFIPSYSQAADSPYDIDSRVLGGAWNDVLGSKSYSMTSGKALVYDVYSSKYTSGGAKIVWKDFGRGNKAYLNFQGWAILFGHKQHTSSNQETYIVAQKIEGKNNIGTNYIYGTLPINISATEDLEYNNKGSGVWNECSSSAINKDNENDCNMRYDGVGFNAYLPISELFPDGTESAKWRLYIVKRVDSQVVYTPLILPFDINNAEFNNGKVSLSSGINANRLRMIGTNVIRRTAPHQSGVSGTTLGYFSTGATYTRTSQDESSTAVWYGVSDSGSTRWANTAYWGFGGDQAIIAYDAPPVHVSSSIDSERYQNGNDYWIKPNDQVYVHLKQYDAIGNLYQYLRLSGSGQDVRSLHRFDEGSTNNNQFSTSSYAAITAAYREIAGLNSQVKWTVVGKRHGDTFDVQYYYVDDAYNPSGDDYVSTGNRIRVDGVVPEHISNELTGYRYKNGNDYWVKPNDIVDVRLRQRDPHSGNKFSYLRLFGNDVDVRSQHGFHEASDHNNQFSTNSNVVISAANREENANTYGKVRYTVQPKTHGHSYNILYYYIDNATNQYDDYEDTGMNLRTDGVAPTVAFRNSDDTADFTSRAWATTQIDVRLKFSDGHSGYKQSRYAWSQSTSTPTTWSSWTTSSNYLASRSGYGQWYLHVQAEDNVGNTVTTYEGPYRYNDPPVANFTPSPNPTDRITSVCFSNTSSDPNGNTLTYDWEYRKKGTSTWTQLSTAKNPCTKFNAVAVFEVKLTVTDSLGASDSVIKEVTVNNLPPVADFTFDKSKYYIGDTAQIRDASYDLDGDPLTYKYTITAPNGRVDTKTVPDYSYYFDQVGNFTLKLEVRDSFGATDSITKIVTVNNLTIIGTVDHTLEWLEIHQKKGNLLDQYYSGEDLVLSSNITNYTANYVKATLTGRLVNGNLYSRSVPLTKYSNTVYKGVLDGGDFIEQYPLRKGIVNIEFEVQYINGQIRKDVVDIEIIDNAINAYNFHRRY